MVSLTYILSMDDTPTDILTKKSDLNDNSLIILYEVPPYMTSILLADVMSVEFIRP